MSALFVSNLTASNKKSTDKVSSTLGEERPPAGKVKTGNAV